MGMTIYKLLKSGLVSVVAVRMRPIWGGQIENVT